MTDPLTQLPLDYSVTIREDFYVNNTVETLILTDYFSQGPYEIVLYEGKAIENYMSHVTRIPIFRGVQQGKTQTSLLSYRKLLES